MYNIAKKYFNSLRMILQNVTSISPSTYFHRNPNKGNLKVPVVWPEFTSTGQQFLDINAKMNESSVGQEMRLRFLHLWLNTLPSLPSIQ